MSSKILCFQLTSNETLFGIGKHTIIWNIDFLTHLMFILSKH